MARTSMEFAPVTEAEEAGIALVQDDRFHYAMTVGMEHGRRWLRLWRTENAVRKCVKSVEIQESDRIYLSVQGHTTGYSFYYGYREQELLLLEENVDASLLSSVVNNGFTGTYIGMYATSNHTESSNYADFDWFDYQGE